MHICHIRTAVYNVLTPSLIPEHMFGASSSSKSLNCTFKCSETGQSDKLNQLDSFKVIKASLSPLSELLKQPVKSFTLFFSIVMSSHDKHVGICINKDMAPISHILPLQGQAIPSVKHPAVYYGAGIALSCYCVRCLFYVFIYWMGSFDSLITVILSLPFEMKWKLVLLCLTGSAV